MKTELIQRLRANIPNGVFDFIETPLGSISDISMPTTRDAAVIACGQLAANLNNALLKPFSGLTPVELMLRIGQQNPVIISALLASLESIADAGGGQMTIVSPRAGGIYTGMFDNWQVTGDGLKSVVVNVGGDTFDLTRGGNSVFSATFPMAIGQYDAIFTGTPESGADVTASVSFSVMDWSTFPIQGGSYRPEQLDHVSVSAPGTDYGEMSVNLFEEGITLIMETAELWTWTADQSFLEKIATLPTGLKNMAITAKDITGGTITSVIDFFLDIAEG